MSDSSGEIAGGGHQGAEGKRPVKRAKRKLALEKNPIQATTVVESAVVDETKSVMESAIANRVDSEALAEVNEKSPAKDEGDRFDAPKRNRRRRKKGKGGQMTLDSQMDAKEPESIPDVVEYEKSPNSFKHDAKRDHHADLAKYAWKIYLAEISEEGVALVEDQDARELSRRCFRLAQIFMDEQARWLR